VVIEYCRIALFIVGLTVHRKGGTHQRLDEESLLNDKKSKPCKSCCIFIGAMEIQIQKRVHFVLEWE
jgi:hypothetical protein